MKCPYCGNPMEPGLIHSQKNLSWSPGDKRLFHWQSDQGLIPLAKMHFTKLTALRAYACKSCQKLVIDYQDGCCDFNREP